MSSKEVEKLEEAKLKAKYPLGNKPLSGHSAFLQKRLAKGVSMKISYVYACAVILIAVDDIYDFKGFDERENSNTHLYDAPIKRFIMGFHVIRQ